MPLREPSYLARKLGAQSRCGLPGSFPTTPEREDRLDWDEAMRVLSDAAFGALIWVAVCGGGLALMDRAFNPAAAF